MYSVLITVLTAINLQP